MGKRFADRVVLITGAAGGMGRAFALKFAVEGAGLILTDVEQQGLEETASLVDATLVVPTVAELMSPVLGVVPLQCFAYAIARSRGNDVDRPRNLAKVVTVE